MEKQSIYVAYAINPREQTAVAMCWHTDRVRAGDVGQALAQQHGLVYSEVLSCNHADTEAALSFPRDHWVNKPK
jgi:hypothetical protein